MHDYFQFVDTSAGNGHSDPPSIELPNQTASHGDASPGTPNNHADDLSPPIWAHNAFDPGASPASKPFQFEDVKTGNGHSDPPSIELPNQTASHGDASPGTPNNRADDLSPPIWAHNAFDPGASPASKPFQFEDVNIGNGPAEPQHNELPGQATLHIQTDISAAAPNNHAGSPLLMPVGNIASDATHDHFHFADLSAGNGIPQGPATYHSPFDLQQTTLQEIIDAAAPAGHVVSAVPNEVLTFASVDPTQMQAHQGRHPRPRWLV